MKNNKKALKQKHKRMFDIIRNELNKADPMGLSPGKACPIDEYDPETTMVMTKIKNGMSRIELSENISLIFAEMFGEDFSASMFYGCAENILKRLQMYGCDLDRSASEINSKEIDTDELYSYFCSAMSHCGTFLLSSSDEDIDYHIFEEFDADCISFLSGSALDSLLNANYISNEIYGSASNLAKLFRELEDTRLWNVEAVRSSAEWLRVLSLADEINNKLNTDASTF